MTQEKFNALLKAAERMDWLQPFFTQADPCFHLAEDGHFCGRAPRWHDDYASHPFVPFASLLREVAGMEETYRSALKTIAGLGEQTGVAAGMQHVAREALAEWRKEEK